MKSSKPKLRFGFTLVELLVVIAIIGILIGMLLPAVQSVRAAARRTACGNKMRQLALAVHNYETAHSLFPVNQVGPGLDGDNDGVFDSGFYSWLVPLLPSVEQGNVYDLLNLRINNGDGDGYQVSVDHPNAAAVNTLIDTFICPSDNPNLENAAILGSANPAPNSYVANAGWPSYSTGVTGERATPGTFNGVIPLSHPSENIAWHGGSKIGFQSITDGSSNTAMISERLIQPGNSADAISNGDRRLKSQHVLARIETLDLIVEQMQSSHTHVFESAHIGRSWASGVPYVAPTYMHVQSPNSFIGHYENDGDQGIFAGDFVITPSSNHTGGVNMSMADGATRFVSDTVDQNVWWAIGGRNDGRIETLDN